METAHRLKDASGHLDARRHWPRVQGVCFAQVGGDPVGSAANLQIHLHCLVLGGVYRRTGDDPVLVEVSVPTCMFSAFTRRCVALPMTARRWSNCAVTSPDRRWRTNACKRTPRVSRSSNSWRFRAQRQAARAGGAAGTRTTRTDRPSGRMRGDLCASPPSAAELSQAAQAGLSCDTTWVQVPCCLHRPACPRSSGRLTSTASLTGTAIFRKYSVSL